MCILTPNPPQTGHLNRMIGADPWQRVGCCAAESAITRQWKPEGESGPRLLSIAGRGRDRDSRDNAAEGGIQHVGCRRVG